MRKYKLFYGKLNLKSIKEKEFSNSTDRFISISEMVCVKPKKVFVLIVRYGTDDVFSDVYIFENITCIRKIADSRFKDFWLFEFESYEDAYAYALDYKEVSPLCYSRRKKTKIKGANKVKNIFAK